MKRYGHLFEQAFSRAGLIQGFHDAAKSKRSRRACFVFERSLGAQISALHRELHSGTYAPRPYFTFTIYEPKTRLIFAPAFRDCVVQHAIYRVISPIFERTFIGQSFACRKGYGTHKAADYAQQALQASPPGSYTLQLDIRKFFYRIDRDILRTLIKKKIKDERMVDLMTAFAEYGDPVGIPIGNLLSQLYALIYLNPLDHFIKRELRTVRYCRYVDDFVLFGISRARAVECRKKIIDFIRDELHLELSRSTIAPIARGLNFVGYRTWASQRFIRRRSLYNFRQALKKGKLNSAVSILGHARRTHSLQHLINLTKEKYHGIYRQLPQITRTLRLPVGVDNTALGTELATIDGITYVSLPDGAVLPADQPAEIATSVQTVTLTEDLRTAIKAASPHTRLIASRMIEQIRARHSIDDEMYFARISIGSANGMYDASVGELAEVAAFGAFVEGVRDWGRSQRAALGL